MKAKKTNFRTHKLYPTWDKVPVTYYQKGTSNNFFQWYWHSQKIDLAAKVIGETKFLNCLDVGCASGYMVDSLRQIFPDAKYFAVDIYDKAIFYAKKTYPEIKFEIAAADDLPYKDNQFDLITFYETIEHVEDPLTSLKELKRVLKKNGTMIVTMDSGSFLFRVVWFVWEKTKGKVWEGAHLHPFTHIELEQIIRKSGLKIKRKIFSHFGMEVTFVVTK